MAAAAAAGRNWTPGAYGIWTLVVLTAGGILLAFVKQMPMRRKIEVDSDSSLRTDLLKRITELELAGVEREKNHRKEMDEERARCDREMGDLKAEVKALREMFITLQKDRVISFGGQAPTTVARFTDKGEA